MVLLRPEFIREKTGALPGNTASGWISLLSFPFSPGVKFHGRDECLAKWLFVLFVRVSENLFPVDL